MSTLRSLCSIAGCLRNKNNKNDNGEEHEAEKVHGCEKSLPATKGSINDLRKANGIRNQLVNSLDDIDWVPA